MGESWKILSWHFWRSPRARWKDKPYLRPRWDGYNRSLGLYVSLWGRCGIIVIRQPILVALPPSATMLHEHANVSETHHPSRGGRSVAWMRHVAKVAERFEGKK